MSQHDFDILNQLFPATRTDLNAAFVALASNSSGDTEPAIKYANQWWYETDTNTLKIRNGANSNWISICTLDQSNNNVLSITTQGLTLGATALTSTGADLNQLTDLTRGSLIYGNASGATARLAKGAAGTVLSSDGTDISWAAAIPTLTRGQIIYSNASGTTAALAPGTAGQVLTSDGTDIAYGDAAGGSTTLGDVGTYAFLEKISTAQSDFIVAGTSYAGSLYKFSGFSRSAGNNISTSPSSTPSGTWRAMGAVGTAFTGTNYRATLFVRIS